PDVALRAKRRHPIELTLPLTTVKPADRPVRDDKLSQRREQAPPFRMHLDEHEDEPLRQLPLGAAARENRAHPLPFGDGPLCIGGEKELALVLEVLVEHAC